jgi:hypothetical protein
MKLGGIPNVSLPPIKTCAMHLPCYEKCYAMKSYRQYPSVRKNWTENLKLWQSKKNLGLKNFVNQLHDWLKKKKPEYFRWHVGGDIPDTQYFEMMCHIAEMNPKTKFLAFTKQYDYAGLAVPENLQLIFSRWPGCMPWYALGHIGGERQFIREAWLSDPKKVDVYMPMKNMHRCPGSCKDCKVCFNKGKQDIIFDIH